MTSLVVVEAERGKQYSMINFEETELRLGLPGGSEHKIGGGGGGGGGGGKRGFSETDGNVDLKLNLSSNDLGSVSSVSSTLPPNKTVNDPAKPPAKAQVVGWPPVRSFRKNIVNVQKSSNNEHAEKKLSTTTATTAASNGGNSAVAAGAFVKVSMDGAPYLRKVDLKLYKSYKELSDALGKMFSSFTTIGGSCGSHQGMMKDFMNESKLIDLLNGSDYVPTYQDKDGDWMLLGDVPWEMFVESCKRLRIMKGSEAIGLAPRAVEKCKNRS